jgi:protein tyrosine/serine phosphatase
VRIPGSFARTVGAAFLATCLALPASAEVRARDEAANPTVAPAIHIDNFGEISPVYYRGSLPKGSNVKDLAALGVKTVIDLTDDDGDPGEQAAVERAGMSYVHIAMTTRQSPTADQLAEFLKVANDPASQPVYVHCVGGRHRTGVMTAAYRMTHDGWTAERSFAEMKQYKFGADFLHPEFKAFVYAYPTATAAAAATATAASANVQSTKVK